MSNLYLGLGILLMTGGIMSAGAGGLVLGKGDKPMCNVLTLTAMALVFCGAWLWRMS